AFQYLEMDSFLGPRLYGRFDRAHDRAENGILWAGEGIMSFLRGLHGFARLFSPLIIGYAYSRGFLTTPSSLYGVAKLIALAITSAYLARFIGRMLDNEYMHFIQVWRRAFSDPEARNELKRFDYALAGAPADFVAQPNDKLWFLPADPTASRNPLTRIAAYAAVHSFGIRMLYPGATGLLNLLLGGSLRQARKLAIQSKSAKRAVLQSARGDSVDTLFKRGSGSHASTLVICSEGNAGYYEIGIMGTVETLGYSILGWNQPGFGESTGAPFPEQTLSSADAVWQYATEVLGYKEEEIVVFGWSIGGFPSTWLAANHPKIKGLVLDATFDDLLPLAEFRMPAFASSIVKVAVRDFLNLDIAGQLSKYAGPVRLIRRLQEEILITDESGTEEEKRSSNRANALLKRLLQQRHGELVEGLLPHVDTWLSMSGTQRLMARGLTANASEEAMRVARVYKLCEHYLVDFDATHVTPLSSDYFNLPQPIPAYHM
ncbi:hypothetical protein PFISCL1PPCAC_10984, partial [Pristionchus fissidentatus]